MVRRPGLDQSVQILTGLVDCNILYNYTNQYYVNCTFIGYFSKKEKKRVNGDEMNKKINYNFGTAKKTVFYNTSLASATQGKQKKENSQVPMTWMHPDLMNLAVAH